MLVEKLKKYKFIIIGIVVLLIIIIVLVLTSNKNNETSPTQSNSNQSSSGESSRTTTTIPTTTSELITTAAPTTTQLTPEEICQTGDIQSCTLSNEELLNHPSLCSFREFNRNAPPFRCLKNAYYKVNPNVTGNWSITIQPNSVRGNMPDGFTTGTTSPQSQKTITNNNIDSNNKNYFTYTPNLLEEYLKERYSTVISGPTQGTPTIEVKENNGFKGSIELYFEDKIGNSEDSLFASLTVS